jgi:DNA-binding MarR family transcriptional regulator
MEDHWIAEHPQDERLARRLALTAKALQVQFDGLLGQVGGSLPSWIALNVLMHTGGISQRQLADCMHVEGPTVTHHLDRWAADGLIERHRDPADRRVIRVQLTEAGRRLHREMAVVADDADAKLRALMSPDERRTLEDLLDRIRRHLTQPEVADPEEARVQ